MKFYNTLTRQVEEFIPRQEGKVKMYTCGPTVYNFAHIGNLRTYLMEDVLEKTLRYLWRLCGRCGTRCSTAPFGCWTLRLPLS